MKINRLLITGAAGGLGKMLRQSLAGDFPILRLSSRKGLEPAAPHEEIMHCDLADAPAMDRLLEGVDAVVHLGGQATEADWETVHASNIVGAYNLWEAARKAGTRRILFASSNHAIGFQRRTTRLDETAPARPDSLYGLSKAFGEDLGRYYADKYGVSCMSIRIGSSYEQPVDRRMLSTWMSYRDFTQLVRVGLSADYHYEIVYGCSDNTRSWWDNRNAYRLGFGSEDNAEAWAAAVEGKVSDDPVTELFQGGSFAAKGFAGDIDRID
jgi:uronate dehydrogenase